MPVTQVIGPVHMTQQDPLEMRRQEGSSCSTVTSEAICSGDATALAARESAQQPAGVQRR
jgi:hypothetical protein